MTHQIFFQPLFRFFFGILPDLQKECSVAHLHILPLQLHQAVFWTFTQKLRVKKTTTQNQETQNSGCFFINIKKKLSTFNHFCLKLGNLVQEFKNSPKTQGKSSENLNFTTNPRPSIRRKIVQ